MLSNYQLNWLTWHTNQRK